MKLKVKLKNFEEIASVSVPEVIYRDGRYIIMLKNLGYKNFNIQDGKYLFDSEFMIPLLNKELVVIYDNIEKSYTYKTIVFGRWMLDILGKE